MIAILSIVGLVLFYLFILIPTQVQKKVLLEKLNKLNYLYEKILDRIRD